MPTEKLKSLSSVRSKPVPKSMTHFKISSAAQHPDVIYKAQVTHQSGFNPHILARPKVASTSTSTYQGLTLRE